MRRGDSWMVSCCAAPRFAADATTATSAASPEQVGAACQRCPGHGYIQQADRIYPTTRQHFVCARDVATPEAAPED